MIPMLIGNMASGTVLDVQGFARTEFRHLLRLRHGQSRHRRSLALHQNGRRAGHVRRRRGSHHRAHRHRRLLRDEGHEHAQRRSQTRLAPLRQGTRRLRHGRRRGRHRARRTGTRQKARREDLLRNRRLRQHRRRAPSHRAVPRWRRRGPLHENGAAPGRPESRRRFLHQRPRHLHAAGRRLRNPGHQDRFRRATRKNWPSVPPKARPATCWARRARWK